MAELIKKYTILLIVIIVLARVLTATLLLVFPDLLTTKISENATNTMVSGFLEIGIEYVLNIMLIALLYDDMKKYNILIIPILILTFFSNILGVLFFLVIAYKTSNYKTTTICQNL